jgi:hypothetical protein
VLDAPEDEKVLGRVAVEVKDLCKQFPLYAKRLSRM